MKEKFKYIYNKLYTGSFLKDKIGHETKNFLLDDNGKRYIYVNPDGIVPAKKGRDIEYVFHIINASNYKKGYFELIGISKVYKGPNEAITEEPKFKGVGYNQLFDLLKGSYGQLTFKCETLYLPKNNKNIYITFKNNKPSVLKEDDILTIKSSSNFGQYLRVYAKNGDESILNDIITNINEWFDIAKDDNAFFDKIPSELPFCLISGRVSLELSMSNMISYFLNRDQELLKAFIAKFLNINIDDDESFETKREEENIDLIFESKKRVIVIENKIDSNINGIKKANYSQLSKYYDYVQKEYKKLEKHYYVILPEYNNISQELINQYKHGNKYEIKTYKQLFDSVMNVWEYKPNGSKADEYQKFLFNEFRENVKYLTLTNAGREQYIAYIRIKQKIEKLKVK